MKKWLLFFMALIALGIFYNISNYKQEFKMTNFAEPIQQNQNFKPIAKQIKKQNIIIEPKAKYQIYAKAASVKHYPKYEVEDYLVPYDFALVWGNLMKKEILEKIKISQSNRWYYFRYSLPAPIAHGYIENHSANVHIIPSNKLLQIQLGKIKKGENVYLEGYLVDFTIFNGDKSIVKNTSLTREDTGGGSCEIMYVTKLASKRGEFK